MSPDWFLDHVVIREVDNAGREVEPESIFRCERWLAKNKEDGKIDRELLEANFMQTANQKVSEEANQSEEGQKSQGLKALKRRRRDGETKSPSE